MFQIMKAFLSVVIAIFAIYSSSCAPKSTLPVNGEEKTTEPVQQVLKTTMGDFVINSTRLVDEVNNQQSQPEEKFLLVILTDPNGKNLVPGEFLLEDFQKMIQDSNGQIYVLGEGDFQIISTMAGWVEDEFVLGFRVPIVDSYTLSWSGNSPIELNPKDE
ncbi:MAG: hypothetical protein CVU46_00730 [Chloroflexi bacterium HGW-Chloroflexi-8]|nr:MAG: hypothetical protein CVU46_00730 [Chloroflexi bacterium HGW-Chloroflexi-8]